MKAKRSNAEAASVWKIYLHAYIFRTYIHTYIHRQTSVDLYGSGPGAAPATQIEREVLQVLLRCSKCCACRANRA